MKKLIIVLFLFISFAPTLEGAWCGCPCMDRYYNPAGANSDSRFYGYMDINEYPYSLPVNYCFNPRPCGSKRCVVNYSIRFQPECEPRQVCPHCNQCHE